MNEMSCKLNELFHLFIVQKNGLLFSMSDLFVRTTSSTLGTSTTGSFGEPESLERV